MKTKVTVKELGQISPYRFGFFTFIGTFFFMLLFGFLSSNEEAVWEVALTGLGLFAWLNAVMGFFNPKWGAYILQSIITYFILAFLLIAGASLISTNNFLDMEVDQTLLMVITIFFFVGTFMAKFIQNITQFLEGQ